MLGFEYRETPAVLHGRTRGKSKFPVQEHGGLALIFCAVRAPIVIFGLLG